MTDRHYTTSTAFLEALREAGVRYVFANLGSDHPGLIEAMARARADGRQATVPELIVCPHETVALSAAHAFAAVAGQPQAVLVHVDAGTQNLGGAVNNAARGRVPVLIFAGSAPYTISGELPGGRNEFIHWLQDVHDQRGILRNYVKYSGEIRTGRNVRQLVHRAMQIARTEPAGPVYLVGPREVMEQELEPPAAPATAAPATAAPATAAGATASGPADSAGAAGYPAVTPAALTGETAGHIARALAGARHPLVITSYLGRDPAAVEDLVRLCDLLAIPVIESVPQYLNFPADHPMHCGYQWTTQEQDPLLAQADVILVIDSDVPWIHVTNRPGADAAIYYVDADPLKYQMAMWHVPARLFAGANSRVAVRQILDEAVTMARDPALGEAAAARRTGITAVHDTHRAQWDALERPDGGVITPEYLTACVRDAIAGEDALVLSEAITSYHVVARHLRLARPGSLFSSGGGSLGWAGGGAVGAKLAAPDRTVVCLVGDGSYLFGVPSSAQWVARRYGTPALTVIYDNHGWRAPKQSTLALHADGAAAAAADFGVSFEPVADLAGIARAAGGAHARTVADPAELPSALKEALAVVHGGTSAVLSAQLPAA